MRKKLLLLFFLISVFTQTFSQSRIITGKVTDYNGTALENVSVTVKNSPGGTVTSSDGSFSISVPERSAVLVFSTIGMSTKEISVSSGSTFVNVQLTEQQQELQDIVVLGYSTVKKSEATGAVSKVKGSELAQKPIGSFTQLLQGKAPGVQVTGSSGRPGANGFIRIRGTGSINGVSEPLILVDGVSINTQTYNLLNPNDIEDITILKDAASASIYGSRGANGVIVITTKKGKGKPQLQYSFQYGVLQAQKLKNARVMNALEKLNYEFEGGYVNELLDTMITNRINSGAYPAGTDLFTLSEDMRTDLWATAAGRGQDWRDYLFQKGIVQRHEVSLSAATDKVRYFFSLNKDDNDGVVYSSFWNRKGARLNLEFKALDWFTIGTNLGISHTREKQIRENFNVQNSNLALSSFNQYEPVYLPNGKYNMTISGFSPLEGADFNPYFQDRLATFSSVFGEAKFFNHLTLRSQLGINYSTRKVESYLMPGSNLANILGYNEKTDLGNSDFLYVFTNTANWKQTFGENHNLSVLVGTEFTKDKFYSYTLSARGFPTSSVNTLDNAPQKTGASTTREDWALISYFANATYDFKKKYYLTVTIRRDGSSRFGKDNQFANFYGLGVAWDINKEDFFNIGFINSLRLKLSAGTAGNNGIANNNTTGQAVQNYAALGTYALNRGYSDRPAAVPARIANPRLTWEENQNYDATLEFGFLGNRITGSFGYYYRKSSNLLFPVNLSQTTGFDSYTGNIGSLKNSGIEIALGGDIMRTKNFIWNISADYTNNDNKVLTLYSDNVPITTGLARLKIGEPVSTFYLVRWAGVNPDNGRNQFYNNDGTITETYSAGQAVLMKGKSPNVRYFGSINSDLSYKGFNLGIRFYYSGGNYIMNYEYQSSASEGESIYYNQWAEAQNYWKKPGDIVQHANLLDPTQNVTFDTDKYLQKGDYITLRDVTLSYNLPANIISKAKMKGMRVFVQGTNLWVGTKYKGIVEVGDGGENVQYAPGQVAAFNFPQVTGATFGVNITF